MRVKLTYTAEIEDVVAEAANLLANVGNKITTAMELFNGVITNLQSDGFNSAQLHHDMELLRRQLGELDIRLLEVNQIVDGYEQYTRELRSAPSAAATDFVVGPPEDQNGEVQYEEEKTEENDDY